MKKKLIAVFTCLIIIDPFMGNMAFAGDPNNDQYVSKKQYDQLKEEMEKLKEQMKFLLKQQSQPTVVQEKSDTQPVQQDKTKEDIAELKNEVKTLKAQNEKLDDGTTGFLLTGYAFAGYSDYESSGSSFNVGFNPIFLWRLRDDLLFEGELEIELEDGSTNVGLEFAQLSYLLNDYMTIGMGKFLNPSNYFIERLHPAWINKLIDKPITMTGDNRIQAGSQLGAQFRGGVPLGSTRGEYAFYVSNGPTMRPDGSLSFTDFSGDNVAVGGRIGWLPFAGFEIGYGFEVADVDDLNGNSLGMLTNIVDLNYLLTSKKIYGNLDIRGQFANRQIDRSSSPALAFNNRSSGGYAQIAYRPSLSGVFLLNDFESVFRYDWIDLPNAADFNDEQRWTVGLNYYLAASTLVKFAYQFDNKQGAPDDDALMIQVSSGF